MADKDPEENLSLQLPSFGFGRKKSKDEPADPGTEATEELPEATPDPEPEPMPMPTPTPTPDPAPEPTPPVTPAPAVAEARPAARPVPPPALAEPDLRPTTVSTSEPQPVPVDTTAKRKRSFPSIPALQAVLAVGALIGILGVLLTFASLKFCELVRGTDSCGGPGVFLLLATLIVMTYVGAWLLRGFGIDDPGSTSFLAVALLVVVTMVFLLSWIYSWWMILVVPPVSMAMFALSWWVTSSFVDTDDGRT